jgi:iron complex transport system substrate-binding protein
MTPQRDRADRLPFSAVQLNPLIIALCTLLLPCASASGDAAGPHRVVTMNACADQLAMLISREGQLYSVSALAADSAGSVLSEEAKRYVLNNGFAEEIFMMRPDLVLAGSYTSRTSVAMLRRLGIRVEDLPPTNTFAEIRTQIRHVGNLLSRSKRAEELVAELDGQLSALAGPKPGEQRPLAVLHYFNNYTSGSGTLAGEIVALSGLRNLGSELGLVGTVHLPLERLVMAQPDIVVAENKTGDVQIHVYDSFDHPALQKATGGKPFVSIPDKYWVCGAPFTVEAVRMLARAAGAARERTQ